MQAIEYVKVDYKDRRPTTEFPARHGPDDPVKGIEQLWFERGNPTRYFGLAPDDADLSTPGIIREIPSAEWDELYQSELARRQNEKMGTARDARKWTEQSGITINGMSLRTDEKSQARITSLVTAVSADPEADNFDFEAQPGVWINVNRDVALEIGKAVSAHVQACFTNCRALHEQIQAAQTLEELNEVDIHAGWPGSDAS